MLASCINSCSCVTVLLALSALDLKVTHQRWLTSTTSKCKKEISLFWPQMVGFWSPMLNHWVSLVNLFQLLCMRFQLYRQFSPLGVFDNLFDQEIANLVSLAISPYEAAALTATLSLNRTGWLIPHPNTSIPPLDYVRSGFATSPQVSLLMLHSTWRSTVLTTKSSRKPISEHRPSSVWSGVLSFTRSSSTHAVRSSVAKSGGLLFWWEDGRHHVHRCLDSLTESWKVEAALLNKTIEEGMSESISKATLPYRKFTDYVMIRSQCSRFCTSDHKITCVVYSTHECLLLCSLMRE